MSLTQVKTQAPAVIFFDVGGTLLRSTPSVGEIYARTAAKYGIEVDHREIERRARRLFLEDKNRDRSGDVSPHTASLDLARAWWRRMVRESFGPAGGHPRFDAFFEEVFEEFARPERFELFPEAGPLLDRIEARGIRMGIISNWDERLRPVLEGLDLVRRFDPIIISAEVGHEKPDPRIFQIARRQAGVAEDARLVHVGDSHIDDLDGANAAGFEGRLIRRHEGHTLAEALADLLEG